MKAADIIAGINARLPNVESFRPLSLGPQCIGLWSIRQDGLSCRLEIVIDERWQTYPVRLLVPLRAGPNADDLLQRIQSARRHQTLVIEHHVDGDRQWILVRFHLRPGFYFEGLPWIIHAVVLSVGRAAQGTSGTIAARSPANDGGTVCRTLVSSVLPRHRPQRVPIKTDAEGQTPGVGR